MVARQFLNQIVTFSVKFVQCDIVKHILVLGKFVLPVSK